MNISTWALLLFQAANTAASQYRPTLFPGALIAWWICSRRKKSPIGGWLLYYYWQLYAGLLMTIGLFAANVDAYIPENHEDLTHFLLFGASAVPSILIFFVQAMVATFLLLSRTANMLLLLRRVMAAQVMAEAIGLLVDVTYFPDSLSLSIYSFASQSLWLAYFYRSQRVHHVFSVNDWDAAVEVMYPAVPKIV